MKIYTIGFTQKSAKQFFDLINKHKIELLIDIRLNNKSQLAGFTKGNDLEYFLNVICKCKYQYHADCAPTKEILDDYKHKIINWDEYIKRYIPLMNERQVVDNLMESICGYNNVCLLCSEPTAEQCHRRLLAEMIMYKYPAISIEHI